jgi:hypothetical protein
MLLLRARLRPIAVPPRAHPLAWRQVVLNSEFFSKSIRGIVEEPAVVLDAIRGNFDRDLVSRTWAGPDLKKPRTDLSVGDTAAARCSDLSLSFPLFKLHRWRLGRYPLHEHASARLVTCLEGTAVVQCDVDPYLGDASPDTVRLDLERWVHDRQPGRRNRRGASSSACARPYMLASARSPREPS